MCIGHKLLLFTYTYMYLLEIVEQYHCCSFIVAKVATHIQHTNKFCIIVSTVCNYLLLMNIIHYSYMYSYTLCLPPLLPLPVLLLAIHMHKYT